MKVTSSQTWAIVGVAALIWLGLSLLGVTSGEDPTIVFDLVDIIPALLLGTFIVERWVWRWQLLHRIGLVSTPVVIGTWRGELKSFWPDSETSQVLPPKTVYLAIRQTATTVAVRLLTDESSSRLISGGITDNESGYPAISYSYRNDPQLELRNGGSEIHYGGAVLDIIGKPAVELDGRYWTDRKTSGVFKFREHTREVAQSYDQAVSCKYAAPKPAGVFR